VWNEAASDQGLRKNLTKLANLWEAQHTLPAALMSSIQAVINPPAIPANSLSAPLPAPPQLLWSPSPLPTASHPHQQPILLPPLQVPPPPPNFYSAGFQAYMASQGWGSLPMPAPHFLSQGFPTLMLPGGHTPQVPPPVQPLPPPAQQPAAPLPPQAPDLAATLESLSRQFGVNYSSLHPQQAAREAPLPPPPLLAAPAGTQQPIVITQNNIKVRLCNPARGSPTRGAWPSSVVFRRCQVCFQRGSGNGVTGNTSGLQVCVQVQQAAN
jgi:hypothetical protein